MIKIKEATYRKAKRLTVKGSDGSYTMNEADISITAEAEEGQLNGVELREKVKRELELLLNNNPESKDPDWINTKQEFEKKEVQNG